MTKNRLLRMDNVGIVVESLDEVISFLTELGLELEGRTTNKGEWQGVSPLHREKESEIII